MPGEESSCSYAMGTCEEVQRAEYPEPHFWLPYWHELCESSIHEDLHLFRLDRLIHRHLEGDAVASVRAFVDNLIAGGLAPRELVLRMILSADSCSNAAKILMSM